MVVKLMHQEPARTMGDPFTAYVPGEVTQVLRMTFVHPMILEKSPANRGSQLSAPGTSYNDGKSNYSVSYWKTHPGIEVVQCTSKFLEKSREYRCNRPFAPGTRWNREGPIYSLSSWRSHPGIEDDQCTP